MSDHEENECQIVGCNLPSCEESLDYAMMCREHYILWLEVQIPLEDHPESCICSLHPKLKKNQISILSKLN